MSDIATKLTTIAENQQRVYDAGYTAGQSAGGDTDAAYQRCVEAERQAFWDAFQWKGTRTSYAMYVFGHGGFSFDNFYPKYDIKPTGSCQYLFYNWRSAEDSKQGLNATGNLAQRLNECGVKLDVSNCERLTGLFGYGYFTELPPINVTGLIYDSTNLFTYNGRLVTIGTITTKESVTYGGWFDSCGALENITFDGAIGQNIDLSSSTKLTHDSLMSIINHLAEVSSTRTLTLGATNLAKLTDAEKAIATEKGWSLA